MMSCASGHRAAWQRRVATADYTSVPPSARSYPLGRRGSATPTAAVVDMTKLVDTYLSGLPDTYYNVGTVDALKDLMTNGNALVVDVREAKDYAAGHIPGSSISRSAPSPRTSTRSRPTVRCLHCASGLRSTTVMAVMQVLGYTNARTFFPAYKGWTTANQP